MSIQMGCQDMLSGRIVNTKVEDFDGRTINQVLPHVVHLGRNTCRKLISEVCGAKFASKDFITIKDLALALNVTERCIRATLSNTGTGNELVRRYMYKTPNRVVFFSLKSIVVFSVINRHRSNACRVISTNAYKHCNFKEDPVIETEPQRDQIKVIPASSTETRVIGSIPIKTMQGEVAVAIQPGTIVRIAAI